MALSPYSEVLGIPLGVFGIGYFAALLILLMSNRTKRLESGLVWDTAFFTLSVLGGLSSVVLIYISVFMLKAKCLVCLGMHLCIGINLAVVLTNIDFRRLSLDYSVFRRSVMAVALILIFPGTYAALRTTIAGWMLSREVAAVEGLNPSDLLDENPLNDAHLAQPRSANVFGESTNPIRVTEFVDLECAKCREMWEPSKSLLNVFPNLVQVEVRHFPMGRECNANVKKAINPLSCQLAYAAECAAEVGKLRDFMDWAFAHQWNLDRQKLTAHLTNLGVNEPDVCMASERTRSAVAEDIAAAVRGDIKGTPLIVINQRRFKGPVSGATLRRAVSLLLESEARQ